MKVLIDKYDSLLKMREDFCSATEKLLSLIKGNEVNLTELKFALLTIENMIPEAITEVVKIESELSKKMKEQ